MYPRVFMVSSEQPEDPYKVSCKLMIDDFYKPDGNKLDPRAMFIIQGDHSQNCPVHIWQGNEIPTGNQNPYMTAAQKHIKNL